MRKSVCIYRDAVLEFGNESHPRDGRFASQNLYCRFWPHSVLWEFMRSVGDKGEIYHGMGKE